MARSKRKQRSMSAGRIAMAAVVVALLVGIGLVAKNIVALSIEKRELLKQNEELKDKRDELTAELENVNDPDYIEEQARKLLHMIKPGEILYILNGSGQPRPEGGDNGVGLPTRPEGSYSDNEDEEESNETSEGESYSGEDSYSEEGSYQEEEEDYEEDSGEWSDSEESDESSEDDGSEG